MQKIPYDKKIENFVRDRIKKGATIKSIFQGIQKYQNAPRSQSVFYTKYGHVINEERGKLEDEIGELVITRAKESDRILELLARSRGHFNPTDKVAVAETDMENLEEDKSAVDDLMIMLGKKKEEPDNDDNSE